MIWTRRRVSAALLGGAGLAVGGAAAAAWPKRGDSPPPPARRGASPAAVGESRILQVVAHPDDDLYFLNPDLVGSLLMGYPHLTVCTTCGESDGKNVPADDPRIAQTPADFEGYAAARFAGWRRAYAKMAVGNAEAAWRREPIDTAGHGVAEIATLTQAPQVQLVTLNCWDNPVNSPTGGSRIFDLWSKPSSRQPTMRPTGTPVPGTYAYNRDDMIRTLVGLFEQFRPTLVRTLDPDPDYEERGEDKPHYATSGGFSDHQSHIGTALFTFAALHEWWRRGAGGQVAVESYRGYYNRHWPANLSDAARQEKERILAVYAGDDISSCTNRAGCGDRKLSAPKLSGGYGQSVTRRYPPPPTWLQRGADGRLAAFAVFGGRTVMWTERQPGGGVFEGPVPVGGQRLLPQLSVLRLTDGRWQLFGVRMTLQADPRRQARDVVFATQRRPGGSFGDWVSIGNPYGDDNADPVRRRGIGIPVAGLRRDGRVQVFIRNFDFGVSSRLASSGDDWGPWRDLGSADVQDGLGVLATGTEPVQCFGSGRSGIRYWRESGPDGECTRDLLKTDPPAGPTTVVPLPDGRALLLTREAGAGGVRGYQRNRSTGGWDPKPLRFGGSGQGAVGAVAVGTTGALLLAGRGEDGVPAVCWATLSPAPGAGPWTPLQGAAQLGVPALALDSRGTPVVAVVRADGRLWAARLPGRDSSPQVLRVTGPQ